MKRMLSIFLITLMATTIGFSNHDPDANRIEHRESPSTSTRCHRYAHDADGSLTARTRTLTQQNESQHKWFARGQVRNSNNAYIGNWSFYAAVPHNDDSMEVGPDTFGSYQGAFSRNYPRRQGMEGTANETHDARQSINSCHVGAVISGWQQGDSANYDLADSHIPW